MSLTRRIRASLLATLLAMPLAGIVMISVNHDALAQTSGGWRKEVYDKFVAAQEAGKKSNFSESIRLLKEAKAKAPLSPQEEHAVNEYLIYAASSANEHRLVIQTVDERIATGRVSGADLVRKLRLKASKHYTLREYREAAATLAKLSTAQGSLSTEDLILLGNCQIQLRDFRSAAATLENAVAGAEKARKPAATIGNLLEMLNKAYFETKNDAKRMQTLHRLMAVAPKQSVFKQLVSAYEQASAKDPVVMINIYRLGASRNLLSGEHFAKYAETALDLSSPGEGVAMIEKGMSAGTIKKDDRNNRLLADAKSQVGRAKATLKQQEAEAKATASGEPEAKLATTYFTLKNYPKVVETAKRALEKKKLRREDDVYMLLGIALVESKKGAEAKNAFKAAAAAAEKIKKSRGAADLWSSMTG